jgi:hypothetical protein
MWSIWLVYLYYRIEENLQSKKTKVLFPNVSSSPSLAETLVAAEQLHRLVIHPFLGLRND